MIDVRFFWGARIASHGFFLLFFVPKIKKRLKKPPFIERIERLGHFNTSMRILLRY